MIDEKSLLNIIQNMSDNYAGKFAHSDKIIHLFTGGSNQHGARLVNNGDLDICGIYCESLDQLTMMRNIETGYVGGTSNPTVKNTSTDQDFTFKTLREWAFLASKGNPTMLGYLFTPIDICDPVYKDSVWFTKIVPNNKLFASKAAGVAFKGYAKAQYERMQGLRGTGKHGQRDELTSKFGFDCKAAMHMIRMMNEGIEFMQTGNITYPRPEAFELIAIRRGDRSKQYIESLYTALNEQLLIEIQNSTLPEKTDAEKINKLLLETHIEAWRR